MVNLFVPFVPLPGMLFPASLSTSNSGVLELLGGS